MKDESLKRKVARLLESKADVLKFADTVATETSNPTHTFSWADDAFKNAAKWETGLAATELRSKGHSWVQVAEWLRDHVMNEARHPSRSTGSCHNLTAQYLLSARADLLEEIERTLAWEEK